MAVNHLLCYVAFVEEKGKDDQHFHIILTLLIMLLDFAGTDITCFILYVGGQLRALHTSLIFMKSKNSRK